jgi:hypothetical protein
MIEQGTTNADIKSLRILCAALMAGMIIFGAIAVAINSFDPIADEKLQVYSEIALAISVGFAGICFLIARYFFGKRMGAIKSSSVNVYEKLNQYRTAFVSYMALCEAPGLLAVVLFLLSGIYWLLLVTIAMILAMAAKFPTKQKLINDMELDWTEQQELE